MSLARVRPAPVEYRFDSGSGAGSTGANASSTTDTPDRSALLGQPHLLVTTQIRNLGSSFGYGVTAALDVRCPCLNLGFGNGCNCARNWTCIVIGRGRHNLEYPGRQNNAGQRIRSQISAHRQSAQAVWSFQAGAAFRHFLIGVKYEKIGTEVYTRGSSIIIQPQSGVGGSGGIRIGEVIHSISALRLGHRAYSEKCQKQAAYSQP